MHSDIDLHCGSEQFVEVTLDESLRTTEARERIERELLDRNEGRIMPTKKGFMYYPPDERWDEERIVNRLHMLLMDLFGDGHSVSYRKHRDGDLIKRYPDGSEVGNEPVPG